MTDTKTIGVVGGVGPYAGIDLVKKIFDNTKANTDQENLPVALISIPEKIHDRTEFLLDETKPNPAKQIFEIIKQLESIGAIVVGIPCNTVHSPKIFDVIKNKLSESKSKVKLINMIKEVTNHIQKNVQKQNK